MKQVKTFFVAFLLSLGTLSGWAQCEYYYYPEENKGYFGENCALYRVLLPIFTLNSLISNDLA